MKMDAFYFDSGFSNSYHRSLRRTLVRQQFYSGLIPTFCITSLLTPVLE